MSQDRNEKRRGKPLERSKQACLAFGAFVTFYARHSGNVGHFSSVMEINVTHINEALGELRAGRLPNYTLADLRCLSAGCVGFIQNHFPDAVHLKSAIDDEIRRKEAQESADRLLHQTEMLVQYSKTLTEQTDTLLQCTKEAQASADRLLRQTEMLVQHSETLTKQTDTLLQYTAKLTRFTRGAFWFTIVLGILALIQIVIMIAHI